MTRRYAIAGRVIQSTIELPELRAASHPGRVWLNVDEGPPPPRGDLVHRYAEDDGSVWLELERTTRGYCFHFPDFAQFGLERSESRLTVHAAPGTSNAAMRHMLLDQAIPLLLVLEGLTVLHASAVAIGTGSGTRAVLFVGESGSGKSTTAAGCHLAGATLLADDFSVIDTSVPLPTVTPSGTGSRLWNDVTAQIGPRTAAQASEGDGSKARLPPPPWPERAGTVPISAIYVLGERSGLAADPTATLLGPSEACTTLMSHSFRASLNDLKENQCSLEAAARLVERVAVRRLTIPARLDDLVGVCRQILEWEISRARSPAPKTANSTASR